MSIQLIVRLHYKAIQVVSNTTCFWSYLMWMCVNTLRMQYTDQVWSVTHEPYWLTCWLNIKGYRNLLPVSLLVHGSYVSVFSMAFVAFQIPHIKSEHLLASLTNPQQHRARSPSFNSPKLPQPIFLPTRKFGPTMSTPDEPDEPEGRDECPLRLPWETLVLRAGRSLNLSLCGSMVWAGQAGGCLGRKYWSEGPPRLGQRPPPPPPHLVTGSPRVVQPLSLDKGWLSRTPAPPSQPNTQWRGSAWGWSWEWCRGKPARMKAQKHSSW